MLRKAFQSWRDRHASWQQGRAKVTRAAALWHNRALAGAWQQWKEAAVYQQELRLRLTGAIGTWHVMSTACLHSACLEQCLLFFMGHCCQQGNRAFQ